MVTLPTVEYFHGLLEISSMGEAAKDHIIIKPEVNSRGGWFG